MLLDGVTQGAAGVPDVSDLLIRGRKELLMLPTVISNLFLQRNPDSTPKAARCLGSWLLLQLDRPTLHQEPQHSLSTSHSFLGRR